MRRPNAATVRVVIKVPKITMIFVGYLPVVPQPITNGVYKLVPEVGADVGPQMKTASASAGEFQRKSGKFGRTEATEVEIETQEREKVVFC